MAWIKDGKIWKIVSAMSQETMNFKIKSHQERGWELEGQIKPHGYGLGCLMFCERKGLRDNYKI